ncbi:transcription initiation factor TFIID subunit 4-like [Glandiceps talaboti]
MASADSSLEEIFTSDIDESAVNALVGSLEAHLASQSTHVQAGQVSANSVDNNHVGNTSISAPTILQAKAAQQAQKTAVGQSSSNSNSLSNSPLNAVDQAKNGTKNQSVTINSVVVSSGTTTPTAVVAPTTKSQAQGSGTPTTCVRIITLPTASGKQVLATQSLANVSLLQNVSKQSQITTSSPIVAARTVMSNTISPGNVITNVSTASPSSTPPTVLRIVTTQGIQSNVSTAVPVSTTSQSMNTKVGAAVGKLTVREQLAQAQQNSVTRPQTSTVIPQQVILKQDPSKTQPSVVVPQSSGAVVKTTVTNSPQFVTVNVAGQGTITLPSSALSGNTTRVITTTQPQMQHKLAPRVVTTPIRIAAVPQAIAPRPPGVTVPQGVNLPPGMVLVKQEGGGVQLIQNAAVAGALQQRANMTSVPGATTYRFTTVQPGTQMVAAGQPQQVSMQQPTGQQQVVQSVVQPTGVQKVATTSQQPTTTQQQLQTATPIVIGVQHVQKAMATAQTASATVPSVVTVTSAPINVASSNVTMATSSVTGSSATPQVVQATAVAAVSNATSANTTLGAAQQSIPVSQSAMENVKKCRNFLTTLIKLASNQPPETIRNVKELVQNLIDDKIQPEDFTLQLQKELKSSPQPYLVPFLKRSLPLLRQTLHKTPIQGLRAPTLTSNTIALPTTTVASTPTVFTTGSPGTTTVTLTQQQLLKMQHQLKMHHPLHHQQPSSKPGVTRHLVVTQHGSTAAGGLTAVGQFAGIKAMKGRTAISSLSTTLQGQKDKTKYSSTFRDDDDINDVASMAGVNLTEENARILATNAEFIGTQVRSCKEEQFLHPTPLQRKVAEIARRHGLDEPSSELCTMLSHATQERLKDLVGKLALIAQHRMEIYKNDSRYDVTTDVKAKLKFFEQLDALERKRHNEQEREMLLRAAKSRSKQEDPEQLKLKQKAKEMQQMELEQMRKRDANMTALLAIGPRKKRKLDSPGPGSSSSTSLQGGNGSGSSSMSPSMSSRPQLKQRVKRVNLRDLIFLLEQEQESKKSTLLYKAFLK